MEINLLTKDKKMFICSYDIPRSILRKYKGNGYYDPEGHGYDSYDIALREYAIDVDDFCLEWLVDIELDDPTKEQGGISEKQ